MTSKLDTIFGKSGADNAIDPVCKMVVSKSNPKGGTAEHNGETYYFCAPGCRAAFEAEPQKYLIGGEHHEHGDHDHMGHHHH